MGAPFGKGHQSPAEIRETRDAQTGARLWQVTDQPCINHNLYFLTSSFTPDGRGIVFASNRSGRMNFYRAGFPDGSITQLTDGDGIGGYSGVISAEGRRLYFTEGSVVRSLDLGDLCETVLAEFAGAGLGEVSVSADGSWLVCAAKIAGRSHIAVVAADGSDARLIHHQDRTIIHPQFHPLDADWIEFASDPAPRMHVIRRGGTGLACLYEHGNDEFVVHETWLGRTGDLAFTVWPHALKRMELPSRRIRTIADFNAWHIAPSRDGTKILCDTNHPDLGLQLVDVATGRRRTICHPARSCGGSQWKTSRYALKEDFERAARTGASDDRSRALSWMEMKVDTVYGPQWTHPHPSFSPDERMACFTSDRTGHPQVYAV